MQPCRAGAGRTLDMSFGLVSSPSRVPRDRSYIYYIYKEKERERQSVTHTYLGICISREARTCIYICIRATPVTG